MQNQNGIQTEIKQADFSGLKGKIEAKKTDEKKQANGLDPVNMLILQMNSQIQKALPKGLSSDRFQRIAMTSLRVNETLAKTAIKNPMSFIAALMQSVQMGLEPNTPLGEAYLIPYGDQVQFQIGYKGLINLAYRTGEYHSIYAHPVYPGDFFKYKLGLEMSLEHVPADHPETGEPTHYYAVWKRKDGGTGFAVMSAAQVLFHAKKFSKNFDNPKSNWKLNFESMALKTVLIKSLKYAQKSIEFASEIASDATFKSEISDDMKNVEAKFESDIEIDSQEVI